MNGSIFWIWLMLGLTPYHVERSLKDGKHTLEVRALYWSLLIQSGPVGNRLWKVHIPLVERLQRAIWAALERLRGDKVPPD